MKLFGKHNYNNLDEAVVYADKCTSLNLQFLTYNLVDKGQDFLKLHRLIQLYIQGYSPIYHDYTFELPEEIGQLGHLQRLTLLNLPLNLFPKWILKLINLKYLMVRGTGITKIPDDINRLRNVKTLRIENCELASLSSGLSQMHHLRKLGLCDTRLTKIKADMLPSNLTHINFFGTGCYKVNDLKQLKVDLMRTKIYP